MKPLLLHLVASAAPLLALAAPAPAAEAPAAAPGAPGGDRPNLLFVLTEDQGTHLSLLGTPGLRTPHMDALARRGVYFERAHVNYPVCSASKANILTGTYGHTNGVIGNTQNYFVPAAELTPAQRNNRVYRRVSVRPELPTLTELLTEAGYHAAVSGKLHLSPNEKFPYDEMLRESTRGRAAGVIARAGAAPWFFLANVQRPHRPFRDSNQVPIGVDLAAVEPPAFLPDTPACRRDWAEYLDAVQLADHQLGELLAAVEEAGQLDRTLVVFTSDHGPAYHRGKMSLYQFGLRVPLALAGPGVARGLRTRELTSAVDLLPTLMDLLGLPTPPGVQGRSVAGLARGRPGARGATSVFAEVVHQGQTRDDGMQERSVFDGRYKLIHRENPRKPRDVNADLREWAPWRNRVHRDIVARRNRFPRAFELLAATQPQAFGVEPPVAELYDLDADPSELDNLAGDPAQAENLARLKGLLAGWLDATGDPYTTREGLR